MKQVPSIATMSPDQILVKQPFRVPVPDAAAGLSAGAPRTAASAVTVDSLRYEYRSQADFVREFNPSSHAINSIKYYPNSVFRDMSEGKLRAKIHTRVAVAYQQMIKTKRKTALLGNNVGMRLVSDRNARAGLDVLSRLREGWEEANMEIAVDKGIDSDYTTGDAAVYLYVSGGQVGWRVFSYNNGDILFPHFNPLTGEIELLGRLYHETDENGKDTEYLDVIDSTYYAIYRRDLGKDGNGWVLEMAPVPHNFPVCPVAYHRTASGPVWSASQSLIDCFEMGISQFCEYNTAYGLGILFTSGADFSIDTDQDGTPLHLDSTNADAKAAFLNPAAEGADSAFAKQLEILDKNIMRSSFVQHAPEMKSGADMSGITVKMLNSDPYYKALEDSQEYQLFIERIVRLFKYAYGITQGLENEFRSIQIKAYLDPFYFLSETEIVNALVQLTSIGVLSRRSATEIAYNAGYGVAGEWDRVQQQVHDDFIAESGEAAATERRNPVAESRSEQ